MQLGFNINKIKIVDSILKSIPNEGKVNLFTFDSIQVKVNYMVTLIRIIQYFNDNDIKYSIDSTDELEPTIYYKVNNKDNIELVNDKLITKYIKTNNEGRPLVPKLLNIANIDLKYVEDLNDIDYNNYTKLYTHYYNFYTTIETDTMYIKFYRVSTSVPMKYKRTTSVIMNIEMKVDIDLKDINKDWILKYIEPVESIITLINDSRTIDVQSSSIINEFYSLWNKNNQYVRTLNIKHIRFESYDYIKSNINKYVKIDLGTNVYHAINVIVIITYRYLIIIPHDKKYTPLRYNFTFDDNEELLDNIRSDNTQSDILLVCEAYITNDTIRSLFLNRDLNDTNLMIVDYLYSISFTIANKIGSTNIEYIKSYEDRIMKLRDDIEEYDELISQLPFNIEVVSGTNLNENDFNKSNNLMLKSKLYNSSSYLITNSLNVVSGTRYINDYRDILSTKYKIDRSVFNYDIPLITNNLNIVDIDFSLQYTMNVDSMFNSLTQLSIPINHNELEYNRFLYKLIKDVVKFSTLDDTDVNRIDLLQLVPFESDRLDSLYLKFKTVFLVSNNMKLFSITPNTLILDDDNEHTNNISKYKFVVSSNEDRLINFMIDKDITYVELIYTIDTIPKSISTSNIISTKNITEGGNMLSTIIKEYKEGTNLYVSKELYKTQASLLTIDELKKLYEDRVLLVPESRGIIECIICKYDPYYYKMKDESSKQHSYNGLKRDLATLLSRDTLAIEDVNDLKHKSIIKDIATYLNLKFNIIYYDNRGNVSNIVINEKLNDNGYRTIDVLYDKNGFAVFKV